MKNDPADPLREGKENDPHVELNSILELGREAREMPKSEKNHDRKLYELIEGRIKIIQQGIKSLYLGSDEITADLIHGLSKNIYYLKDIMHDLLFDEKTAKEILEERS